MSLSDETQALFKKRESALGNLSPQMAMLITHVSKAGFAHGVHYDDENSEVYEEAYQGVLDDEIALAEAIYELQRKLNQAVTHAQHLQNCVDGQILEYRAEVENSARKDAQYEATLERVMRDGRNKIDELERIVKELEPDLSLYGKGEPKSLEELKASHDRLFKVPLPLPFAECNNCGVRPTLDDLEAGECPKCGDELIVYTVDVAKYIKGLLFSGDSLS